MKLGGKMIAIAGGLGLLAGALLLFQPRARSTPRPVATDTSSAIPHDTSNATGQTKSTNPGTTQVPPGSWPLEQAVTAGPATESPLPSAPSGDFETNLSPEQVAVLVERRYAALFRNLELPAPDLARLRELLIERQQAAIDAANSAILVGVNPVRDPATIHRVVTLAQAEIDAAIARELGESVLAACAESDRALPARNAVAELSRALAATAQPLRPEQEKQLERILVNFRGAETAPDIDRTIFGGINTRAALTDQAVVASAQILSAAQLQQWRELQPISASGGPR